MDREGPTPQGGASVADTSPTDGEVAAASLTVPTDSASPHPVARRRRYPYLVAGALYLALSVLVWGHVWTGHPSAVTTCGCGDASPTIWFTFWPAYAISHGLDPLFSTAVGYPSGISLVFAPFGIALAPLTWIVGTIASLNVALTAIPVLSALAMFALVRRWVTWMPAAFVAGLFYGFSPFVLNNLASSHIDLTLVAVPPLVVMCLDELLVRQRRRPVPTGIVLGVLLSLQFLIGTEVLVLLLVEGAIGIALVVLDAARRDPAALRVHAPHAVRGVLAGAATACVLLAYPVWLIVAGPAHYSGTIHPGLRLSSFGGSAQHFFVPAKPAVHGAFSSAFFGIVGGYQGPVLSAQFFGVGVLVVCVAGIAVWRRQRILWLFGLLAVISMFLVTSSGPLLGSLPVLENVVPSHYVLFAYFAVAVLLGVIVDNTRTAIDNLSERSVGEPSAAGPSDRRTPRRRWTGAAGGLGVAFVALFPPAAYVSQGIPFTVQPIVLPTWFRTVAPHLAGHPVVLVLPAPLSATTSKLKWTDANGRTYPLIFSGKQAAMTWQALGGQRFSMVGSGGLGAGTVRSRAGNAGQNVISRVTFAYGAPPVVSSGDVEAVRRALRGWHVDTVVLPDQPELPEYDQVASVPDMAALITGATGIRPTYIAKAWVWNGVGRVTPPTTPTAQRFTACTTTVGSSGPAVVDRVVACMLAPPTA
jgi:hypothetical protein